MKNIIIVLIVIVLAGAGIYYLTQKPTETVIPNRNGVTEGDSMTDDHMEGDAMDKKDENQEGEIIIGTSVEGNEIKAYRYGTGSDEILFVGGIHGGYSWNTSLVAFEMMKYLEANKDNIPENVQVTVIPVMNPDGLKKVVGTTGEFNKSDVPSSQDARISGRFNANNVDLNRNFDCEWQSSGKWQNRTVDGGDKVFSEPESRAIKGYVESRNLAGAVVWYSAAGGVFASTCHNGVSPEIKELTNIYADASGYQAYQSFDFYEITGDMVNWLAKVDVPAISVLLTTHEVVEWDKNKAGLEALLAHFAK